MFTANRCERCVNDRFDDEAGTGDSCPIWMTLVIGDHDPHVYWDEKNKHGECDMFHPLTDVLAKEIAAIEEMQAYLTVLNSNGPQALLRRDQVIDRISRRWDA